MERIPRVFEQRGATEWPSRVAFWVGALAICAGVVLHLPMFADSAPMGYSMAGMEVDAGMIAGMVLIVAGTLIAGWSLLPTGAFDSCRTRALALTVVQDGEVKSQHVKLLVCIALALIIDAMKPATLAFVVPGVAVEYRLSRSVVALLPLAGLSGTMAGSYVWGWLADFFGRRAAILLAALMFIGTAICGTMPSFRWNLVMCFLMGLAAGGMLPIALTLLAEVMPARHRGFFLVLLGGLTILGGYLSASISARLLEPHFGWRVLWLTGLPTGLLLIILNRYIPESPKFLLLHGRVREAEAILSRYGARLARSPSMQHPTATSMEPHSARRPQLALTLNLVALLWGLINFGVLLWLPSELRARGLSVASADLLLSKSAFLAFPSAALTAWLYERSSGKWALAAASLVTALALFGLVLVDFGAVSPDAAGWLISSLMVGAGGVIAVLIPYAAETTLLKQRGRATGLVAASSKLGGVAAQCAGLAGLLPSLTPGTLFLACAMLATGVWVIACAPRQGTRLLNG